MNFDSADSRIKLIVGDGRAMPFEKGSFETVLCIQVLEHVFEPEVMVKEIARVLTNSGHAIFLIPQTSTLHLAPHHYYNFTKFWIQEVLERSGLEILECRAMGGIFSTMAFPFVYFFLQS